MKNLRSNMKEISGDESRKPTLYKGISLHSVPRFHSFNRLLDNDNIIIGKFGASMHLVSIASGQARYIASYIKGYETYNSDNFIWTKIRNDRESREGSELKTVTGGVLIHLPTEEFIQIQSPPEEIDTSRIFKSQNRIIEWNGNSFETQKIAENPDDSDIVYEEEEIYGGQETMKTPTTDMRELEHVEWDLYLGKIEEKVPYIRSKEEAREWIMGEIDPTPPGKDMRMVLDTHMDKDEYERITEMAEEH